MSEWVTERQPQDASSEGNDDAEDVKSDAAVHLMDGSVQEPPLSATLIAAAALVSFCDKDVL